jgi:predicted O-linked N-acetylglucosamine transferase (SPINDLY family)
MHPGDVPRGRTALGAKQFERPLVAAHRLTRTTAIRTRPLRVAYVSPDFSDHAHAFYLLPPLANHDRDAVQAVCYSSVVSPDAVTARLRCRRARVA